MATAEALPLDRSREHLFTLRARFEHDCSERGLKRAEAALERTNHLVGQVATAADNSDIVLSREAGFRGWSAYMRDERSTLPTISHADVGRLVQFLGRLDQYIGWMQDDADRIRDVLPHLVDSSLIADHEGPLDKLLAELDGDEDKDKDEAA